MSLVGTMAAPSDDQPRLGFATTRELLEEVEARMRITQNSTNGRQLGWLCGQALKNLDQRVLDYKTVSEGKAP